MTIEHVIELQERSGIDLTVLSNTMSISRSAAETKQDRAALQAQTLATIHRANRYMAEVQDRFRGKVVAIASCLPCGGDAFLRELERAVVEDGLRGVFIASSHDGHYPDDDEALPFFELVTRLDIPVMLHPPAAAYGEERMRDYRLLSSIGRPGDSCLAIGRLIVRGIFEKFPNLKLVASHLGGGFTARHHTLGNFGTLFGIEFRTSATDTAFGARLIQPGLRPLPDHGALELGKTADHLHHHLRPAVDAGLRAQIGG